MSIIGKRMRTLQLLIQACLSTPSHYDYNECIVIFILLKSLTTSILTNQENK